MPDEDIFKKFGNATTFVITEEGVDFLVSSGISLEELYQAFRKRMSKELIETFFKEKP